MAYNILPEDLQNTPSTPATGEQFSFGTLEETTPSNPPGAFSLETPPIALQPKAVERRADEAHFGLGENSPGRDTLKNAIATGTDGFLREADARRMEYEERNRRTMMIRDMAEKQQGPVTPEQADQIMRIGTTVPKIDPSTLWENQYSRAVVNQTTATLSATFDAIGKAFGIEPEKSMDMMEITQELLTKKRIARNLREEHDAYTKEQGTGTKVLDFLEGFIPGKAWWQLSDAAKNSKLEGIPLAYGSTMAEVVSNLATLPVDEYRKRSTEIYDYLKTRNIYDAERFLNALDSYTNDDKFLDNAFSVLDVATAPGIGLLAKGASGVAGGVGKAAVRAPGAIAKGALEEGKGFVGSLSSALKGIVRSGGDKAEQILSQAGDAKNAAKATVAKDLMMEIKGVDPLNAQGSFTSRIISIFNPGAMVDASNMSAEAIRRLSTVLGEQGDTLLKALTRVNTIDRLTPEALRVGLDEAWEILQKRYIHVNDAVIDVKPLVTRDVLPENNPLVNVGAKQVILGYINGDVFETAEAANKFARDFYKLGEDYTIIDHGAGKVISIVKYVDETTPKVREALLISTNNRKEEGGILANMFRGLRTADDNVPQFQRQNRKQVLSALNNIEKAAMEVAESIRNLSKSERNDLRVILERNRDAVTNLPNGDMKYGEWHKSVFELENAYQTIHGRPITEKEIQAYYSYIQLNDLDYMVRNATIFRDKTRLGIEEIALKHHVIIPDTGVHFYQPQELSGGGKFVDSLPDINRSDWSVMLHINLPGDPGKVLQAKQILGSDLRDIEDLLKDGYKIIQIANPNAYPMEKIVGRVPVNYIITKDFERRPLSWTQIPYQEGGHKSYATDWFVKQPKIARTTGEALPDGTPARTAHTFEGDTSIMGFGSEAEAKKYASLMDQARILLKDNKTQELKDFLAKHLPFDYKHFTSLFEDSVDDVGRRVPAALHKDDPISHVFSGQRTSDTVEYKDIYSDFTDNIRSPHNLWANIDKEFAGQKNMDLMSVSEREPIFKLTTAEKIDPLKTMNDSIANVMRNRLMADYKISAVETWVQEFGDLLKGADKFLLETNPVYYLHNGILDTSNPNAGRISLAKAQREAILRLLGTDSPLNSWLEWTRRKLVDSIYESKGQTASNKLAFSDIYKETDPFKYARQVAFHSKLGLFNPVQLFLQAQTLTHVMAIAGPVNGAAGTMAGTMMSLLRYTENPKIIDWYAKKAAALGFNNPTWFKESYEEMRRLGLWHVEGEHSWVSNTLDPQLYKGVAGTFLDKGTFFFREGERLTRMAAWNAAYLEWRKVNPTAQINNAVRRQLVDRQNMFTVNMMRDANASWQQGAFSVPTQFLGYQARLSEQLLGNRLTNVEKARAIATYSLMYGIPAGTAAFTGAIPGFPDGDDMKKWILNNGNKWMGVDFNNEAVDFATRGMLDTAVAMVSGEKFNLSSRWGPSNMWKELLKDDKGFLEIALGASGSIIGDMKKSADPFAKAIGSVFSDDPSTQYAPQPEDFLFLANNVSTISQASKLVWALNTGIYFSRNGVKQSDISPISAIFTAITGTSPRDVSDAMLMQQSLKDTKKAQDDAQKFITDYFRRANAAAAKDDYASFENYMRLVKIHFIAGGFQDKDLATVYRKASEGLLNTSSKIRQDFWKNAPKSQQELRIQDTFKGLN